MAASGDLRQILSPARFNTLSSDTQSVLLQAWNTHTGLLKSELEKTKVDSEQKISVLEKKNKEIEGKLTTFIEESEKGSSALSLYREQATSTGVTAARLTDQNTKLAAERDELRRQFFNAKAERDDIAGLSERRGEEIERLHEKTRELTEEVSTAVSSKCEAQARLDDLDTKEMNISFKEKRFTEEKAFLESQIELLKEEIDRRNEEVLGAKRDAGVRQIELTQELAEKTEQLRSSLKREESAIEDCETFKHRAEKLSERLLEARESESKLEDNYRAELRSQTKLTDLYRQQGEENTHKTEELSNAVSSLQQMVKDAEEKYAKLENQIDVVKADHKVEVDSKAESIAALHRELEEANKLIKTVKDKGLTEDAIDHLSPSAAQASRLLKSGITLTGIYAQMVSLSEELTAEKEENKRINSYMDHILLEIEERAPILRQQREDYERAISALGGLTENLEAAREEVELRRREAEEARRTVNSLEKDRDRLDQQVSDLGRQTSVLVREVEAARSGGQTVEPLQTLDMSSTESVIESRLLTFKDVSELQQRNIELLAVVRQLSENRDQAESNLVQEKTAEVRQELDTALRQAEELRSARERQQLMVENIIQQRDLYKSMCANKETPLVSTQQPETTEGKSRRELDLEKLLNEVKKDFFDYKQDKTENYNMLDKENKKLREDLFDSRSSAAKLASHEEYNNEKFNIAQTNCASFKKQIDALEVRNNQLDSIIARHENSITSMKDELMKSTRKLSHAELKVDQLSQSNSHLKSLEARLNAEIEILYREKNTSSQIMSNLQQIQVNLERKEDENRIRIQETNSQLSKEVVLLRKKLDEDQDHFKSSVKNWDTTNRELREKAERAEDSCQKASEALAAMTTTLETMKEELKEKQEELSLAESRLAGRGQLASQASTTDGEGKNRYRDVEILLGKSKQEIKQLNNHLAAEKKKVEEFKMISETAEKRMLESSNAMVDFKNDADNKIKLLETEKVATEKISVESQTLVKELRKKIEDLEAEVGTNGGVLREKFKHTCNELEEARNTIAGLENQDEEIRDRLNVLAEDCKEAQEKYQRELLLHAKDIEALNKLKSESEAKMSNLEEIEMEKNKAEERISEMKVTFELESEKLGGEVVVLREQIEVLNQENKVLMNQFESLSGQLADISQSGQILETSQLDESVKSLNRSINEDEESRDQLVSIIKFLRREKEIVGGRLEVAAAELARTKRQFEHAQKAATDAQSALDSERHETNENLMTAGKHADLVRKVQSLAAITDSNKLLREERDRLAAVVDSAQEEATKANEKISPLESKVKELEDKYGNLVVEKLALQTECESWKKRSDQLVEKSFKMNPEELKRLQDAEGRLTKTVHTLCVEKKQLQAQCASSAKELSSAKLNLVSAQADLKKFRKDLEDKTKELKSFNSREVAQKNQLSNLTKQTNELKKKVEELEKAKSENLALINKQKNELTLALSKASEAKVGGEEVASLKARLAEIEQQKAAVVDELSKNKGILKNLKSIGRNYREKSEKAAKEVETLTKEIAGLTEKCSEVNADLITKSEELKNAKDLVESLGPEAMQKMIEDNEELKKTNEDLEKKCTEKEERAKKVLETAKEKLNKLQATISEQKKIIGTSKEKSLIDEKNKEIEQAKAEKELMKSALESQMTKLKNENLGLKTSLLEVKEEKEKQQELLDQLQASKLVAVAGVVHQQEPRKQAQPQAHIQPHRHTPRDEHRPTQTASIRPMSQRAAAQAVVLPTSQANNAQPEIATVQPTVSVSPSVSSVPQVPSTSQLDPSALEFIPIDRSSSSEAMDQADESSRGPGNSRIDMVQASTSSPSGSVSSAQTSTSGGSTQSSGSGTQSSGCSTQSSGSGTQSSVGGIQISGGSTQSSVGSTPSSGCGTQSGGVSIQTTASVQPTLKRSRQNLETDLGSDEPEAGPSGIQKKARTVSSNEEVVEDTADNQDMESDVDEGAIETSSHHGTITSQAQDNLVQDQEDEITIPFSAEPVEEDETEEGEISEDGEEEEETPVPEEDVLAEDDAESGMEQEDGEADNVTPANDPDPEEPVEDVVEENSSEPSSSVGVAAPLQQSLPSVSSSQSAPGFEQDPVEDSVVPSTPKLAQPRRPLGFSEAVSSPQVPVVDRFVFGASGSSSSTPDILVTSSDASLVQQEEAERTSIDISELSQEKEASTRAASPQPQPFPEDLAAAIAEDMEDTSPIVDPEPNEPSASGIEDEGTSRETEEGVSSSGAEVPARPARKPITWSASKDRPASTSPQRSINRVGLGSAGSQKPPATRGMRGGKKRGT